MISKIVSADKAVEDVFNGATIHIGGFFRIGTPEYICDALVNKGVKDLTVICNDIPEGSGYSKLTHNGQVKKIITSYIGADKKIYDMWKDGEVQVVFSPQGTLIERIRAAAGGFGGILVDVGIGTVAEKEFIPPTGIVDDSIPNKRKIEVNGKEYLLETPLKADFAFCYGHTADAHGNIYCPGVSKNFNKFIAGAADITIAEVVETVGIGEMDPERVTIVAPWIDRIVIKK